MQRSFYWRRLDIAGLEHLHLAENSAGFRVDATLICLEGTGFTLRHAWQIDKTFSAQWVEVSRFENGEESRVELRRAGQGWEVDGRRRDDLVGALEPDLSVTPFCNTLALKRMAGAVEFELDTAFVDAADLSVTRSRQAYRRIDNGRIRYIDSGIFDGFEADLDIAEDGFVELYEGLFERVHS